MAHHKSIKEEGVLECNIGVGNSNQRHIFNSVQHEQQNSQLEIGKNESKVSKGEQYLENSLADDIAPHSAGD